MGENHRLDQCQAWKGTVVAARLTLTLPIRLAMLAAQSVEAAETMLVTKKIEPSSPDGSENFCLKKKVIQDLYAGLMSAYGQSSQGYPEEAYSGASPEAKESSANSKHSCSIRRCKCGILENLERGEGFALGASGSGWAREAPVSAGC